jgi:hypothetical protein
MLSHLNSDITMKTFGSLQQDQKKCSLPLCAFPSTLALLTIVDLLLLQHIKS